MSFNEWMNTFLYKNIISHTLFSERWWLLCMRDELEMGTDCYIDPSSSDHSSTSFSSSWLGLLNRESLRAQSPLCASGSHFSILSPTYSNCPEHLVILLSNAHLLPQFFHLFTQVHLLIDGLVEGQYITIRIIILLVSFWHKFLKSEWQQVFSGLQDPSKYSSWFNQWCNLDSFNSSLDL